VEKLREICGAATFTLIIASHCVVAIRDV